MEGECPYCDLSFNEQNYRNLLKHLQNDHVFKCSKCEAWQSGYVLHRNHYEECTVRTTHSYVSEGPIKTTYYEILLWLFVSNGYIHSLAPIMPAMANGPILGTALSFGRDEKQKVINVYTYPHFWYPTHVSLWLVSSFCHSIV